ncbi:probable DNA helicase MCM9 isoform X4 [Nymphaea colorata]|uniref:probable DNA helicase MCM9 isoform X4 n=1 Tax=Nymphaea colorata TaxID=210225 RepID=UPI00214EBF05|nr:probable DNA helicase MCM9 isoform X4 [Nymphaea colorata]
MGAAEAEPGPSVPPMPEDALSDVDYVRELAQFILRNCEQQLRSVLLSQDPMLHFPLVIEFAELLDASPSLAYLIFANPAKFLPLLDEAAHGAQEVVFEAFKDREEMVLKEFLHARIDVSGSPLECPETFPRIGRLRVKHRGILLTLKGTVIRSGPIKMIEGEREYECRKCKQVFKVYPELETGNAIRLPMSCPSKGLKSCGGTHFRFVEGSIVCHDYQEIKIQENVHVVGVGSIPRSIPAILKDDLVDMVKAGDDVVVTGILTAKWSPDVRDVRCDLDPIMVANYIRRTNEFKSDIEIPEDAIETFNQFWAQFQDNPLKGRNAILHGICPQIFGLFTVKLAVALTLVGGVQHVDASGTKVRGESHLLLVGDPGTGKSQFLKFAAKLCTRSVITTGLGSTSAGLTVTAVKEGGEWMLEAGALVLADGGLCCIDEFDSMRGHDRATIHEAMEQQTISIAKQHRGSEKTKDTEDLACVWPLPLLRRYIQYVKRNFQPILTKEAERVLSSYYQLQRRSALQNAARTTIRMLESLIRLAQAHARLMFRNEVTRLDAISAIICMESSMTASAILDDAGNALHSSFSDNPDQEYAKQEKLILEMLKSVDHAS